MYNSNSSTPTTLIKKFLGCIFGAILGTVFHINVVNSLPLPPTRKFFFGASITFLVSLGFGFSSQIRCICFLVIPHFFGKYGRGFVTSFAMMYVLSDERGRCTFDRLADVYDSCTYISCTRMYTSKEEYIFDTCYEGPVANIIQNSQESARSIACTAALTLNHSKQVFDLIHRPFTVAFRDLGYQAEDIKLLAENVKSEFEKVEQEIEGNAPQHRRKRSLNPKAIEEDFENKLDFQCEDMFSLAKAKCREGLRGLHQRCLDKIPLPGIEHGICWPMKAEFVCEIIGLVTRVCDSSNVQTDHLGREYLKAKQKLGELDEMFRANIKWQLEKPKTSTIFKSVSISEIQEKVKYEVNKRKVWFDVALKLVTSLLSFTFLLVFLSAYNYNNSYLQDLRFDNVYMTEYFHKIDARRKERGQRSLLPLKKMEKSEILKPLKWSMRPAERKKLIKGSLRLACQVLVTIVLLAFDFFFYTSMDLVQRHSQVDFNFHGEHYFRVSVHGEGKLAQLVRRVFRAFDSSHNIASISTNKECLPQPTKLESKKVIYICLLWAVVWLLLYFEAYGLRFRRVICSYHYVKREKTRILYLYNDYLKRREGYLRQMRKRVRRLAREDRLAEGLSTMSILRSKFPGLCGWVTLFGIGKKKCLICNEPEKNTSHHCTAEGCCFMYCKECWEDLQICFACKTEVGTEDGDIEADDED